MALSPWASDRILLSLSFFTVDLDTGVILRMKGDGSCDSLLPRI